MVEPQCRWEDIGWTCAPTMRLDCGSLARLYPCSVKTSASKASSLQLPNPSVGPMLLTHGPQGFHLLCVGMCARVHTHIHTSGCRLAAICHSLCLYAERSPAYLVILDQLWLWGTRKLLCCLGGWTTPFTSEVWNPALGRGSLPSCPCLGALLQPKSTI